MNVEEAMRRRRAFRSLEDAATTEESGVYRTDCAQLAPPCFKIRPGAFFVHEEQAGSAAFREIGFLHRYRGVNDGNSCESCGR